MSKALFSSADSPLQIWQLTLDKPVETRIAERLDEVVPLLEWAEERARGGAWVALMISYEAAPAFDSALCAHDSDGIPLAWAAAYSEFWSERQVATDLVSGPWLPKIDRSEYDSAVARIKELIVAGDTYQVNYSFPLTSSFSGDASAWFQELCLAQGATYCVYLDLGRYHVLSLSPELFFERRGDRVITRPMKGTIRRGRWTEEDEALADQLRNSSKDKAENVMIVDLLRNDLGKVSVPGSVHVSSLFEAERYETVWQMTSTVEATLRPGTSFVELMSALFPCGSVTGAPKIRTMQIIRELERFPRGVYTGAIGFLRPNGDCLFNVAIRTVVIDKQTGVATCSVGGGVTIDSTAAGEYEECLVKSRFLQSKPVEFELFETMLVEDGEIFLLERHLERLKKSAAYFGFKFNEKDIFPLLPPIRAKTAKLKLSLRKDGRVRVDTFLNTDKTDLKRIVLATKPIDSSDRFLYHKTTRRDFYSDDVILWNERGEITESGIANVVVRLDGELFTPPVSCGLLPGTFRAYLLDRGEIKERVITIEEFKRASELYLINSVRKWMKAVCVNPCSPVAQL
ncbi:MAG TPA: aminodeoxychorismate synthase component I [Pyrinomonadaceae bacterium]|nr:aminodeoxychorismate synthase component I [Pyrinomonadaceae bacterium]